MEIDEVFRQFFEVGYEDLFRLLLRLTGSTEETEDLVQETFLKLWQMRVSKGVAVLTRKYAITAAVNLWRSLVRHQRHKAHPLTGLDSSHFLKKVNDSPSPQAQVEQHEDVKRLQEAIRQLPLLERLVIVLREYQDLKYPEIADILQVSPRTVLSARARGLHALGRFLRAS